MSVYIVTGKLGNGKTLVTVARIRDALRQGLRVVTNLDLDLKAMFGKDARNVEVIRIPDKPTIQDLEGIGHGYDGKYDESKFGVLVLDECGTWFNSRNWQDKTRKAVNDWFLHARKLRWHVYLIIQDLSMLDSQARDAIAELIVFCRRLDNIRLLLIGGFVKMLTGIRLTLPRIHRAKVTYSSDDIISDVWTYRGTELYSCYQTDQIFLHDYPHGTHCLLTPWHTHGRYAVPMNFRNIMRITKIYWKRFKSPVALATGLLLGAFAMFMKFAQLPEPVPLQSIPNAGQPESEIQPEPEEKNPVIDRLKNLYIIGSMSVQPGQYKYQFSSGVSEARYFTSSDLSASGVHVRPLTECSAELKYSGLSIPVTCLL